MPKALAGHATTSGPRRWLVLVLLEALLVAQASLGSDRDGRGFSKEEVMCDGSRWLFVRGLPHSGTTLVATLVAQHDTVAALRTGRYQDEGQWAQHSFLRVGQRRPSSCKGDIFRCPHMWPPVGAPESSCQRTLLQGGVPSEIQPNSRGASTRSHHRDVRPSIAPAGMVEAAAAATGGGGGGGKNVTAVGQRRAMMGTKRRDGPSSASTGFAFHRPTMTSSRETCWLLLCREWARHVAVGALSQKHGTPSGSHNLVLEKTPDLAVGFLSRVVYPMPRILVVLRHPLFWHFAHPATGGVGGSPAAALMCDQPGRLPCLLSWSLVFPEVAADLLGMNQGSSWVVLRFESLSLHPETSLRTFLPALGLDPNEYPFHRITTAKSRRRLELHRKKKHAEGTILVDGTYTWRSHADPSLRVEEVGQACAEYASSLFEKITSLTGYSMSHPSKSKVESDPVFCQSEQSVIGHKSSGGSKGTNYEGAGRRLPSIWRNSTARCQDLAQARDWLKRQVARVEAACRPPRSPAGL
uniref:Protein-tyrosine sulfotransferase n=1 Tax=Rhizochromulina marina TaxID=1034831 RepID=A0A7S2RV22_9STRA|mmetsp:Transcript_21448/g.62492  ORF Transcript_21448/g.62492 Transcript_21448/m.62492 type:complete len:524 (+) Transcript_21448:156-1727(+)